MDDLLKEFLTETSDSLTQLDVEMVRFEQEPENEATLGNIFRTMHTIKGTCGFLGLPRLEAVAHASENILGKFRDRELRVTPQAVTAILNSVDRIRQMLSDLEETGVESDGDDQALIASLNAIAEAKSQPATNPAAAEVSATVPDDAPSNDRVFDERGFPVAAELLAEVEAALEGNRAPAEPAAPALDLGEIRERNDVVPVALAQAATEVAEVARPSKEGRTPSESAVAAASIRVNVNVLEDLMTLVSELVLTRNQLLQMVRGRDDSEFKIPLQRLSHITSDLQEGVMKSRMQPIGSAWSKLPRIVRDLSVETGKKIDLVMQGEETELDRQVLDLIKDPLTHMVRNSADHGLEMPAQRLAAGKDETGTINLNAYHEGGHIIIVISDDGRGLDVAKIKAKALANGLASESELDQMTDKQIQRFIFEAGLSTAEKITSVSGRGVGMDVVRSNIEKIGGTIELTSIPNRGTTFLIKIPLTLAIVSTLIVEAAAERFAIPQINVLELVRASENSEHRIERVNNAPVLRLRNRLLPLISLRDLLKLQANDNQSEKEFFIVVTQVGTYTFGIIVDRVFDTEEIVVKPVSHIMGEISFYSGNTILGDGSVIMILDPNGIAATAGQIQMAGEDASQMVEKERVRLEKRSSFLLFASENGDRKAVPLGLVARLEEISGDRVERARGQCVVQYRNHLVPLIPFDPNQAWDQSRSYPVIIFADRERSMGLVVNQIVDIVEDDLHIELSSDRPDIIGSAIISGKAVDIVDVGHYLSQAFEDWFGKVEEASSSGEMTVKNVLLVDDSQFFLNLLAPMLSAAGWRVSTADSAEEALRLRDGGHAFDLIISDIDMPGMNGFELARNIRADSRWSTTPMVALSGRSSNEDVRRGLDAGFNDYIRKTNRTELVSELPRKIDDALRIAA